MALPSQIERSTQMSRPVMGRTSGRRGPASLPTPVLAVAAVALLAAGGWGLWYVAYRDQSPLLNPAAGGSKAPVTPIATPSGTPGGPSVSPATPAAKVAAAGQAPVELRQATSARQLVWDGRVRLNSVYSLVSGLNYDAQLDQATLLWAGLIQRVGNSWEVEYGVNKRMDPLNRGISSLGFHLRVRLFKF